MRLTLFFLFSRRLRQQFIPYNMAVGAAMETTVSCLGAESPPDVTEGAHQQEVSADWISMAKSRDEALSDLRSIFSQNANDDQTLSLETFCRLFSQTVEINQQSEST
jgi:hypothetical protein